MKNTRCVTGKKKYSKKEVIKEVRFLKYNKKYPGETPVPYICRHGCGWWHIGNTA